MLSKIHILPVVSSKEIIDKCDKWLNMFKQVHATFKKLVLTDKYIKQNVVMELGFGICVSRSDVKNKKRTIDLELRQHGKIINEGVSISINEANKDVYSYLVASVLDYFLSQNISNKETNLKVSDRILYSIEKPEGEAIVPIFARIDSLIDSSEYQDIVDRIFVNHNMGESSEQLIDNLRNSIFNQQIGDNMDLDINYSSNQCKYILKKTLNCNK